MNTGWHKRNSGLEFGPYTGARMARKPVTGGQRKKLAELAQVAHIDPPDPPNRFVAGREIERLRELVE